MNVVGTPFNLHYESRRAPGYLTLYRLKIPISGSSVSPKLKRIDLSVFVAGQMLVSTGFRPLPNLSYDLVWDGKDAYGRRLQGATDVTVRLTYVYPLVYRSTNRFGPNGTAAMEIGFDIQRADFSLSKVWRGPIGTWQSTVLDLGGWDLSIHHVYDAQNKTLYLGSGGQRDTDSLNFDIITTAAGNGQPGYNGDNIPATQAKVSFPTAVVVGPTGACILLTIRTSGCGESGRMASSPPLPGNGKGCPGTDPCGDGGPATQAQIGVTLPQLP